MSSFKINLFGPPSVRIEGEPMPRLKTRKGIWLLALLALRHGRDVDRVWLAGTLWPDSDEATSLTYLRQTLTDLRKALGPASDRLESSAFRSLRLDMSGADCDVARFDDLIALGTPRAFEEAIALYSGPLLEGCTEDWVFQERESRSQARLRALEQLASHEIETGNPASAVRRLRQVITAEPLRESAYRELMRALAVLGDVAAVMETYRALRQLIQREFNVEPDTETRALFDAIRAESRTRSAEITVPSSVYLASANNPDTRTESATYAPSEDQELRLFEPMRPVKVRLPRFVSEFIGREREVAAIRRSLAASRLVTLTGVGGVGKTRLAVRISEEEAGGFPDGVGFVDFTPLMEPSLVAGATESALGIREHPSPFGPDSLANLLETRSMLLVLDNCEHVLAACAELASNLLKRCPDLRILATSRQRLRISGETEWRVPPLEIPPESIPTDVSAAEALLRSNEALRLFMDRALRVRPNLVTDIGALRTAAAICRRLDGIPLALELAAARLQALTLDQLAERLNDRFKLLVTGDVTAPSRQQTLRAMLEWSHDLLSEGERLHFRRLAVFAGGWTLKAAEAVCFGNACSDFSVLDGLASLVDKSLVLFSEVGGKGRYGMLETVRQYAQERLQPDEVEQARRLHAEHFLAWVEEVSPHLRGVERSERIKELHADYGNLRSALTWCFGEPASQEHEPWFSDWSTQEALSVPKNAERSVIGMRLAAALAEYWGERHAISEGIPWLTIALRQDVGTAPAEVRARALCGLGRLLISLGRILPDSRQTIAARRAYEESLSLFQKLQNALGRADALAGIGLCMDGLGELQPAWKCMEQSLALYRDSGFLPGIASVLNTMGCIRIKQEQKEEGCALLQQSHETAQAAGFSTSIAQLNLGHMAYQAGEYQAARQVFEKHLEVARAQGHQTSAAWLLGLLAGVCRHIGRYAEAQAYVQEDIAIRQSLGLRVNLAHELALLAVIQSDWGDYHRARVHLAEAIAACRTQAQREGRVAPSLPLHPTLQAAAIVIAAEGENTSAVPSERWAVQAARLLGAAEAVREVFTQGPPEEFQPEVAYLHGLLHDRLGEAAYADAWREGRSKTPQQIMEEMSGDRWLM